MHVVFHLLLCVHVEQYMWHQTCTCMYVCCVLCMYCSVPAGVLNPPPPPPTHAHTYTPSQVSLNLAEFHRRVKETVRVACESALLAEDFVPDPVGDPLRAGMAHLLPLYPSPLSLPLYPSPLSLPLSPSSTHHFPTGC